MKRYIEVKHCNDPNHPRQFSVENSEADHVNYEQMKWDDYYIHFGGFFGNIGPHVFAAAPDLLEALQEMVAMWRSVCRSQDWEPEHLIEAVRAQAAIAKAIGESK